MVIIILLLRIDVFSILILLFKGIIILFKIEYLKLLFRKFYLITLNAHSIVTAKEQSNN